MAAVRTDRECIYRKPKSNQRDDGTASEKRFFYFNGRFWKWLFLTECTKRYCGWRPENWYEVSGWLRRWWQEWKHSGIGSPHGKVAEHAGRSWGCGAQRAGIVSAQHRMRICAGILFCKTNAGKRIWKAVVWTAILWRWWDKENIQRYECHLDSEYADGNDFLQHDAGSRNLWVQRRKYWSGACKWRLFWHVWLSWHRPCAQRDWGIHWSCWQRKVYGYFCTGCGESKYCGMWSETFSRVWQGNLDQAPPEVY